MPIPIMGDAGLIRLFSWLSPAFPIGGFAYSQGLETAISDGRVRAKDDLTAWTVGQLHSGPLRNDAYLLAIAARAMSSLDAAGLTAANDLALALQVSAERFAETTEQARSFLESAAAWPVEMPDWLAAKLKGPLALPIAFGALASLHGLSARAAVAGFANAAIGQQISVGVRLIPLGQTAGLSVLAALEPRVEALAEAALAAELGDVSALSYGTDIASLKHEDLNVRIFRS